MRTDNQIQELFGYYFQPARYPHSPGHPGLEIFLRNQPTLKHYDPETVELKVHDQREQAEHPTHELKLVHPWTGRSDYWVTPGSVVVSDRRNKKIQAFTFGAELTIQSEQQLTHLSLQSKAPILEMFELESVPMMLANEVQVMLAELRGKSIGSLDIYEARLATVDPWKLYRSALVELRDRMTDFEVQAVDPCATLRDYISAEIVVLKKLGRWRRDPPKIGSLLLPPRTITDASSGD